MRRAIITFSYTFFLIACDGNSVSQEQDSEDAGVTTTWVDELPGEHRDVIKKALANNRVVVGKLDSLLDMVNSGTKQDDLEEEFGPPDSIKADVVSYIDQRYSYVIYAGFGGLKEVRFKYKDGVSSYVGSTRVQSVAQTSRTKR
jgi:hypothetical protein